MFGPRVTVFSWPRRAMERGKEGEERKEEEEERGPPRSRGWKRRRKRERKGGDSSAKKREFGGENFSAEVVEWEIRILLLPYTTSG